MQGKDIYHEAVKNALIKDITKINQLLLIVVEMEQEEILQWID